MNIIDVHDFVFRRREMADAMFDLEVREVPTFTATIYVGRLHTESGAIASLDKAEEWLQRYVERGLCVSLTETNFIYTGGAEPGFIVGLINYPRFPASVFTLQELAYEIAAGLLELYSQQKVTVVFPFKTVTMGRQGIFEKGR